MRSGVERFRERIVHWSELAGVVLPKDMADSEWAKPFFEDAGHDPLREGTSLKAIWSWEKRHDFSLPRALTAWLGLSDGLYRDVPLIHPLTAIGPMIPFAKMPEMVVQPESWFELGNPGRETVCIDLGYRWPGGDYPIFTSGDDRNESPPRLIAPSFSSWFVQLLREGGREFWFDHDFVSLGDPWVEHRRRVPAPSLPERLQPLATLIKPLMRDDLDERSLASSLGITRSDVEALFRHLQHAQAR